MQTTSSTGGYDCKDAIYFYYMVDDGLTMSYVNQILKSDKIVRFELDKLFQMHCINYNQEKYNKRNLRMVFSMIGYLYLQGNTVKYIDSVIYSDDYYLNLVNAKFKSPKEIIMQSIIRSKLYWLVGFIRKFKNNF